jgi:hypothetical protein
MSVPLFGGKAVEREAARDPGGLISLRVSQEYREYLRRLADHERVCLSALLDRAVAGHAERLRFPNPPRR